MRLSILLCAAGLLAGWSAPSATAEDAGGTGSLLGALSSPGDGDEPVAFAGDLYDWDRNTNVITGYGSIELEQGDRHIASDQIRLYLDKQVAELDGNVAVSQEGETVYGTAATYDLKTQRGTFDKPRTFMDPWHVEADHVERLSETTYRADRARVTTCGPGSREWALDTRDVVVDEESGRLRARNVVGYIGPVPIFYWPVFSQNVNRQRPPITYDVGYKSDVGGFLKLGVAMDVTETIELQPRIEVFTESGVASAFEADGTLFGNTTFHSDLWYLNDFNKENTEDEGVTASRHKFDAYSRTTLPDDWVLLAQLEWLSDRSVLETFFWDDYREREEPESFIDLTRTKPHTVVEVTARKRLDDYTVATDELPNIQATLLEYRLFDSPVFVSATTDNSYAELKPEDDHVLFSRNEARVAVPHRFGRWGTVVPFVDLEGRWHGESNLPGGNDAAWDGWVRPGVALQNRYHATFRSPLKRYTRMRHLFEPTATYSFRDATIPDAEDLAFFDRSQVALDEHRIEVELRNKIQGKRRDGSIHDFIDYRATLITEFDDGTDHLAEIENELVVRPANRWVLTAQSVHDLRREVDAHNVTGKLSYGDPLGISGHIGVVYADSRGIKPSTEITYGGALPLSNRWRVGFRHRIDTEDGELELQEYWVWHAFDCWEVAFSVKDREESISFTGQIGISAWPNAALDRYRDRRLIEGKAKATFSLLDDEVCKPCAEQNLTPHGPEPAP